MSALTIPPEVAAECAKKLFSLAATANRDAMTLVKQAMALAKNEEPARPLGVLRKYVREHNQYGSGEVSTVIASIETAADPKHIERLRRCQAKNDAERAEREKRRTESERPPTCWETAAAQRNIESIIDGVLSPGEAAHVKAQLQSLTARKKKSTRREVGNVTYLT